MALPQDDRLLRITGGPFTASNVLLTDLSGQESMSRLYNFQLDVVCEDLALDAAKVIGKLIKVEIASQFKGGKTRFIHGYINRMTAGDTSGEGSGAGQVRHYRLTMVPWLWFLTQTARCFVYFPEKEEKSVADILKAVFDRAKNELHINDLKIDVSGISELSSRMVTHCVQYRETDFNFASRIMEQYGVFYYFKQSASEHTMVLAMDANYPPADQASIRFPRATASGKSDEDQIRSWQHDYEFVSGKFTHTDYNFQTPSAKLRSDSSKISTQHPDAAKYEVYDYPGEFATPGEGSDDAKVRQQEEEVPHNQVNASSDCRALMPGHSFELQKRKDGSIDAEAGKYVITSVAHQANQPGPEGGGSAARYSNSFSCIPDTVQFRATRVTPKPVVSGIHTALVVGPKGEEIHTDKYGRIKVAFYWDREDDDREQKGRKKVDNGEKFFCWIRVAQNIAGNKWGFMAIPRIGQEVVVDFIEGDPDRPLVVGGVYNEEQMPPYNPEDHKTRTYLKTNSSPGGEGYNELRFEDKKDEEQIFVHAERNMDVRVKNDSMELIYGNCHQIVGDSKIEKGEGGDQEILIKKDRKILIEGDEHQHVKGDELVAVDGDRHTAVKGDQSLKITGSSSHIATKDQLLKGMNISIEGTAICLKSGGNSVTIDPSGVTIVGTLVRVNSGPAPPVISQAAMIMAKKPKDAKPVQADDDKSGAKSAPS